MGAAVRDLPLVSVIIPVWNDAPNLERCLDGLRTQTYSDKCLEIIVVDNGSTDASAEVAARYGVILLREPRLGSYVARNTGLSYARGFYVAFIDSDCQAEAGWIEEGVAAASAIPRLGVLAGRVQVYCEKTSAVALYEQMFSFDQKLNVSQGTCVTANWLSPKSVLSSFGGFDESLRSGADSKLSREIAAAGYAVEYCDKMVICHSARSTVRELLRKRRRVVGGKWVMRSGSSFRLVRVIALITFDALRRVVLATVQPSLCATARWRIIGVVLSVWMAGLLEVTRLRLGFEPRR